MMAEGCSDTFFRFFKHPLILQAILYQKGDHYG